MVTVSDSFSNGVKKSSLYLLGAVVLLCIANIVLMQALVALKPDGKLQVTFLNVGQGDATLIESPTHVQVLIDGGRDAKVLSELPKVMSWFDRSLDVVIATHPDADHIAGLISVLGRYRVGSLFSPRIQGNTPYAAALESAVVLKKVPVTTARRGQVIDIGGGAYIEVLWPDRDVATAETNNGCVVTRVVYGTTSFMLSCDVPREVEKYLVQLDGRALAANVYKAGHHGSRTSSDPLFVGYLAPQYGVFSRGCDNEYGHPHRETADTFQRFGMDVLDTCTDGRVTFVSDGLSVRVN